MDLLQLLTDGKVDEFNAKREPGVRLDFFAADLAGAKLAGANLASVNLQKADLSDADLSGAELTQADLSGADLTSADLKGISAMRSKWRDAYMGEADMADADLMGADLTDADMTDAKAVGIMLSGARLKRAILVNADFSAADLAEARLTGADLSGANLHGAQMRESDLRGAVLTSTKLTATDLTRARMSGVKGNGVALDSACLASVDLSNADLTGATVTGADFTRADFTEAILEGVDLSTATLTEAAIDPKLAEVGTAEGEAIESAAIFIEEPHIAIAGEQLVITWENADRNGKPRLRVASGKAGRKFSGALGTLPVPADLSVANEVVPAADGFVAMTILERPGGTSVNLGSVATDGTIGSARAFKLGYSPVVRPVLRFIDGQHYLFGISRQGPTIVVHRVDADGLNLVFRKNMPTARGFVAGVTPFVLSKGGVLLSLGPKGLGEPMRVPTGFPGRASVTCPIDSGVVLAWLPSIGPGLRYAIVRPGVAPEVCQVLPKDSIGALDALSDGDKAWVAFTREPSEPGERAAAWVVSLPDGKPQRLSTPESEDAAAIHVAISTPGTLPTIGVTSAEGSLEIYQLKPRSTPQVFRVP
jgi:uncharacterized protein YjbI with pentapeptide repeats